MECAGYQLAANTHTRGLPLGQGRWQGLHLQPVGMYPQQAGPCRALAAGAAQTWTVRGLWGTGRRCGRDQGMEPPTRAKGNLQVLPRGSPGAAAAACLLPWPGPQGCPGAVSGHRAKQATAPPSIRSGHVPEEPWMWARHGAAFPLSL